MPGLVIDRAITLHRPDPANPVDVLSKVGGFDIAAMTGFYLGCALRRVAVCQNQTAHYKGW